MDLKFLVQTPLFQGVSEEEADAALVCLDAASKRYAKGESILRAGGQTQALGLVLSGSAHIEKDDLWGNKSILEHIGRGQVFAEAYACVPDEALMVGVVAAEPAEILFLNISRLLEPCSSSCSCRSALIRNLLSVTARKNLTLSRRIFHATPKTIRGKLLSYLSDQVLRQGSRQFEIPFNRQQLADYLSADRSALSNELGKMQREGLLTFRKNQFFLHQENETIP